MKMDLGLLYAVVAGVAAVVNAVLLLKSRDTKYKDTIDRKFCYILVFFMLFALEDCIWGIHMSSVVETTRMGFIIFSYGFHLFAAFSAFMWAGYTVQYVSGSKRSRNVIKTTTQVLLMLQICILISNMFAHGFFYIDEASVYHTGVLRTVNFIIQMSYYAILLIYGISKVADIESDRVDEGKTVLLFSMIPLVFGFGQLLWPDAPMYSVGFMVSSVFIYTTTVTSQREHFLAQTFKAENDRLTSITSGLASDYQAIYYVRIADGKYEVISTSDVFEDKYQSEFAIGGDFFRDIRMNPETIVEDDREYVLQMLSKDNIISELADKISFTFAWRLRQFDGGYRYYKTKIVNPHFGEDLTDVVIGLYDDDENVRKDIEQKHALEEALDAAQEASGAKSKFLFNMSHDIRTPMNAILGFTNLAKKHADNKEYMLECLDKVSLSGEHLLTLINEVLDMSRIESGKMEITNTINSLKADQDKLITIAGELGVDKSIAFRHSIDVRNEYVRYDILHVDQVLLNILSNAFKYTPAGGSVEYTVDQLESSDDSYATYRFVVKDTGIGMSQEFVENIFDEFEREDSATVSGIEGTGLGMSIVKKLVDLMDGTINITSAKGEGTTVEIILTFEIAEATELVGVEEVTDIDTSFLEGKRVLLVDDNPLNREIAVDLLEDQGIITETEEDGKLAVDKLMSVEDEYYDYIFMDVQMPIMDGYTATKELRNCGREWLIRVPIIAMTANAFEEDRKNALDAGMNDHLAKPIDMDAVIRTMAKYKDWKNN